MYQPLSTPIRDLQTMLSAISQVHREIPRLWPDGQFGEDTLEAVMVFQRQAGLPVTGEVDQITWEAIVQTHEEVQRQLAPPRPVSLLPHHGSDILPGQSTPLLYPIQGMFLALSLVFDPVRGGAVTGHLDENTAHNIRWVQSKGAREETGILDKDTWEDISRLYETFIARTPEHQP
ncbi:MAG: peptidoglycan-binding protein [Ruminiclostridium sp.]|nr:peptidoglycan-binding protein [Ruminiclostridium sp.]